MGFFSFKRGNSLVSSQKKPPPLSIPKEGKKPNSRNLDPKTEEMRRVFDKLDSNKDGKISKEEYKLAAKAIGMGNAEQAFQLMDADRDGYIDFEEFMEVQKMGGGGNKEDIEDAFRTYDLDGNGKISAEELMEVMRKLGEQCSLKTCRKMVKGVDLDGDGLIDVKEFTTMMKNTSKIY